MNAPVTPIPAGFRRVSVLSLSRRTNELSTRVQVGPRVDVSVLSLSRRTNEQHAAAGVPSSLLFQCSL